MVVPVIQSCLHDVLAMGNFFGLTLLAVRWMTQLQQSTDTLLDIPQYIRKVFRTVRVDSGSFLVGIKGCSGFILGSSG